MASNAPTRKPSNATNSRVSHKPLKLEMTSLTRSYHQPVVISASGKDVSKEKERKLKSQILKINTKQPTKRVEIVEPVRPVVGNERHVVMSKQHLEQQQQQQQHQHHHQQQQQSQHIRNSRKLKLDEGVARTKDLRSAVVESISLNKQTPKDVKSPEKPEGTQRQIRTKNQSHNTKVFFDKYLKFAYDLSTPMGVRQLEEHFFPNDPSKSNSKSIETSDSNEKQHRSNRSPEEKMTSVHHYTKANE